LETLKIAADLAYSLTGQGKYAESVKIQREQLAVRTRLFGAEHRETLSTASNLAFALSYQGPNQYAEAEQMLQASLGSCQRVLGPCHPLTVGTATTLENVRANMRASFKPKQQPRTAPPTAAGTGPAQPLPSPAGAHVLAVLAQACWIL
jgi:hypothetical protein